MADLSGLLIPFTIIFGQTILRGVQFSWSLVKFALTVRVHHSTGSASSFIPDSDRSPNFSKERGKFAQAETTRLRRRKIFFRASLLLQHTSLQVSHRDMAPHWSKFIDTPPCVRHSETRREKLDTVIENFKMIHAVPVST